MVKSVAFLALCFRRSHNEFETLLQHDYRMENTLRYELPHPIVLRAILVIFGLIPLTLAPYELWRGVFPFNITTPFFGFIMIGGMSVGAAFLAAGLVAPSGILIFSKGLLVVERSYLWGKSRQIVLMADVEKMAVQVSEFNDGPDTYLAVITLKSGQVLRSRHLQTRLAAEKQVAEFKQYSGFEIS